MDCSGFNAVAILINLKTDMKNIFNIILCMLSALISLQCSKPAPKPECYSRRVEMLVDEMFKKLYVPAFIYLKPYIQGHGDALDTYDDLDDSLSFVIYYAITFLSDSKDFSRATKVQDDSIRYFLYSSTIKLPDKDYHLYYRNKNKKIDSIYLNKINDLSKTSEYNCLIGIDFLEVNADTTKVKITAGYGIYKSARREITYTDTFDVQNCKWIVLDSTKWEY